MKILRLTCSGVRGLADRTYSFANPRTGAPLPVVLVTGAPASGKTSLLDAIAAAKEAVGSYGPLPNPRRFARPRVREARITATWLLSEPERSSAGLDTAETETVWEIGAGALRAEVKPSLRRVFAEHSRSPARSKLEYFPANRTLPDEPRSIFGAPSTEADARERATRAPHKYACLIEALRAVANDDAAHAAQALRETGVALRGAVPDPLAAYTEAVARMLPDVRFHGFDQGEVGGPRFIRRTRETVGFDALSDSERQALLFALAFRHLGLDQSLVLIDEPELHVHAAHRARLLHALVELGKDNQIIAATGAAELVNAAAPGQVLDLSAPAKS